MSLPNPYSDDELERLVRRTLDARVSGHEPPEHVWKQIKLELESEKSPQPRRFRMGWLPLAVQSALTLLLVMLGGLGLQTLLDVDEVRDPSRNSLPSVATVYVDEDLASPGLVISDEDDLRLLKNRSNSPSASRTDTGSNDNPPLKVLPDVPPRSLRPEGRSLEPEPSTLFDSANERRLVFGGPFEK
ncbi:MAG: hypothetical protein P8186_03560 [Anaerolineae bacterium]|jgi:hypothetical protein